MIKKFKSLLTLAIIAGVSTTASAQSYYDDDIYYDAEKARKERAEKKLNQAKQKENNRNHSLYGSPLPGSDSYHVYTDNNRDVDEYNRRNQSHSHIDSSAVDGQTGDFAYTRRIERFYNPDVVAGSNDNDLKEYYYESQVENPSTTINLIVQPDYGWYSPYYYTSWRNPWYTPAWGWYDPWYSPAWGPSFSFSWGWGPAWSWGPSWAWGPSWGWGPGWGPSWGGPSWGGGRPYNPRHPGALGHLPNGSGAPAVGSRPSINSNRHPGANNNFVINRPTTGNRPGVSGTVPSTGNRPGVSNRPSTTNRPSVNNNNNSYNRPNYNTNNSNNSYNRPSTTNGGRYNGGSYSGGSRGGFGGGSTGGSRSSGGGRGRH